MNTMADCILLDLLEREVHALLGQNDHEYMVAAVSVFIEQVGNMLEFQNKIIVHHLPHNSI